VQKLPAFDVHADSLTKQFTVAVVQTCRSEGSASLSSANASGSPPVLTGECERLPPSLNWQMRAGCPVSAREASDSIEPPA